jgi:hypothetical protein
MPFLYSYKSLKSEIIIYQNLFIMKLNRYWIYVSQMTTEMFRLLSQSGSFLIDDLSLSL